MASSLGHVLSFTVGCNGIVEIFAVSEYLLGGLFEQKIKQFESR